eukprot:1967688-Amphidinium_carterae.1
MQKQIFKYRLGGNLLEGESGTAQVSGGPRTVSLGCVRSSCVGGPGDCENGAGGHEPVPESAAWQRDSHSQVANRRHSA